MKNTDTVGLFPLFMQDGLRKFKYKNSQTKPIDSVESGKKGAIFAYRNKANMIDGRGVVLTSEEAIFDNQDKFSHWTPNVYRYGTYTSDNRMFTVGHSEKNLRQINTFVIDFDIHSNNDRMTYNDILVAALDMGFMPTLILQSDNGFQAYFVLDNPVFITAKTDFLAIKAAKEVSNNLRKYFAETLPVDLTCNHFGIARIPRTDNVVFYDPEYRYTFKQWLHWSMKQSEFKQNRPSLTVLSGSKGKRQVDEPWFDLLLRKTKFSGKKGTIGRNNTVFTLSLAYFSSGYSQETCEYNMFEFNNRLDNPLQEKELFKIISSAFSGKYQAASREYVLLLCQEWVSEDLTSSDLFVKQGWVKFKKPRDQRKRIHLAEWKEDVLAYISEKSYAYKPYLVTTKKELSEQIGIPARSLDKLLKQLKKDNEVFYKIKSGRNGGICLASVKTLMLSIISLKKEEKQNYITELSRSFGLAGNIIQTKLQELANKQETLIQMDLFELDTG